MSADPAVRAALAAAVPVLRRWGNRWYIFGAQAVAVWGRPRMSADVDITASIEGSSAGFVEAMQSAGFELRVTDWQPFLARTRVLPFLHLASELPLDIVLAGPGLEEEFLDRAVLVDLSGIAVPVISPEDLVVSKILAGRPKDFEDVRTVLSERHERLDLARVRSVLGLLEQALTRSDLRSGFERLLAGVRTT